ncbi:MAG: hypothetical protein ACRELB_05620, partial [Polyangiaceae bacterium]
MLTHEQQTELLDEIRLIGSNGRAEGENTDRFPRTFWPVPEHLRAFDPDVVLIVGPRGAGKSELCIAVIDLQLLPAIAAHVPSIRLPSSTQARWIKAFPIGSNFPDQIVLRDFLTRPSTTDDHVERMWLAYLVRVLSTEMDRKPIEPLLRPQAGDVDAVTKAFGQCTKEAISSLDRLDERLVTEDRYAFVGYDELDTLARADPGSILKAVRGLVGLWATRTRRWRRIRAKIFLRTDLYVRAATSAGADFAKLAANRAEITWSDFHLLAMLARRFGNGGDRLVEYCRQSKVDFIDDQTLGKLPSVERPTEIRPLIERMIGPYMGANAGKGLTFTWVLDHIRDGRGQALPRPLVRLFEIAAEIQKNWTQYPRSPRLVEPRAIRRALDRVSEEHVQAALDEWPWLDGLKRCLSPIAQVPWQTREVTKHVEQDWDALETAAGEGGSNKLPAESARDLIEYLVEVGIFRARRDARIDVPDLFLAGLGLKRKG